MDILKLVQRSSKLFSMDLENHDYKLSNEIEKSRFLILGGAGSIGQAVVKEIFKRNPKVLHVVDLSENNLVELTRDIRSSFGYIPGDFKTFALDIGSVEFDYYYRKNNNFDYVLNFSALKHVRSEKDPFTLMRMIDVNILNTIKTIDLAVKYGAKKYFCVSTDKAANPANMMGATKRIMEYFLKQYSEKISISTARFANVAFSDGSLPYGFMKRIEKEQPLAAPSDIKRYFVTPQEAGELCLFSTIMGSSEDVFFPKLNEENNQIRFSDLAESFLEELGYQPFLCDSEDEARSLILSLKSKGKWPCYFTTSDTSGEKPYEEFFMKGENVCMDRFVDLGIVSLSTKVSSDDLTDFLNEIAILKSNQNWERNDLLRLFKKLIPTFDHIEKNKFLDSKM